jgi:enoyl-CoA hydratase/carnithine racemase
MSDEVVLCELSDEGVATVTLNRPDRMNAWNKDMELAYFDLLDRLDDDGEVRAIVLTGAGRGFCPGMDVGNLEKVVSGQRVDNSGRTRRMTYSLGVRKPMIAAINGACAGIGLLQALCCDVRFAASGVKLATSFSRRGLVAEFASTWLLPRVIGMSNASDLLLSGRTIAAEEAQQLGLVNRVFEPAKLVGEAQSYAADMASNASPWAMAAIKAQLQADIFRTHEESLDEAVAMVQDPARRPDFREGVMSYVEKRPPQFRPLPPRSEWPPLPPEPK